MFSSRVLTSLCVGVLAIAMPAKAALVNLYSDEDWQLFGSGANGQYRSQQFSPSQSTPNSLSGPGAAFFDSAAFRIQLSDPSESLTGSTLRLFAWNTNHATTVAQAPIASVPVNLAGTFDDWVTVTFSPQASSGQYLLALLVGSVGGTDFGLRKSSTDDGGPNNQAFNNGNAASAREYQVRLNAVPEPASLTLLVAGGLVLARRYRRN